MRTRSRAVALAAIAGGALAALAGCAAGGGGEQTGGAESGTMEVWLSDWGAEYEQYWKDLVDEFGNEDVDIELRFVGGSDAHQQYITAISSGTAPCVGLVGNTWVPEFASLGALQPTGRDPEEVRETYVPAAAESVILDDEVYGYPWNAAVRALVYRADLFEEAGLEPPTTWDEVVTTGLAFQEAYPDMYGFGVAGGGQWYYLPNVWAWGGEIATEEDGTWVSGMDSPEAVDAYSFYASLLTEHRLSPEGALTWSGGDMVNAFSQGDLGMFVAGNWDLQSLLLQNPEMEGLVGTALMPEGPGGNNSTFMGGSDFAIFEGCEQARTAGEFIEFVLDPERLVEFTSQLGFMPANVEALEAESTTGSYSSELWSVYPQQLETARFVPTTPSWGAVEATGELVNSMHAIMGGAPAQETMDKLGATMNKVMESDG
ncbi:extracellular solute-binding protein [Agromyces aerolatus]|uniref:extracellular solute-binding protein n=1 Tax=Agromyces sp. LY-1074 TaxID=3074080 RepID=UPI00285F82AB|nr:MULTISPECIES: extracellular solute-binding protein [unclassified Agromyces]MDR5701373.1 extracellular solute-binding protein [Agromyces sp. LY-1074]MDR5706838.1 extracellular solute-binding protein [Agromyces sp. LY-1358]